MKVAGWSSPLVQGPQEHRFPSFCTHIVALALLLLCVHGVASVNAKGIGTSSASFLRNEPGPRSRALGGAHTAVAAGGYALFQNPAGLASLTTNTLSMTQNNAYELINRGMAALSVPVSQS
ncbi:MAG: hypothetical protein ABEK50_00260, partial [bacterium]